jgi:hypothetical protein
VQAHAGSSPVPSAKFGDKEARVNKEQKEAIKRLKYSEGFEKGVYFTISSKEDIDKFLEASGGLHDAVLVGAVYSNARWLPNGSITGSEDDEILTVTFKSQWVDMAIELVFGGLRRANLIGFQANFFPFLTSCYLDFYNGLVVFADDESFNPADLRVNTWIEEYYSGKTKKTTTRDVESETLLREPMTTFIVSKTVRWRFT